ncbi:MAG TPA: class I SAM-dependent methyltransferase [Aquihabitans sp.]|nr:class I SAM-dependent methyltransferase [Aquihabitans sp.]
MAPDATSAPARRGVARSRAILAAMRREQADPVTAYTLLGDDAADLLAERLELRGATVIDVGGGPGYVAEALRSRGAAAFTVDAELAELSLHGRTPADAIVADGRRLPIPDDALDAACTLNAVEHVADPWAFLAELVRVVRPGGTVLVGVTNWWSPWGGHETSPWHYLGGERAARRYRARTGREAKNRFGTSLFPVRIGDLLRWARERNDAVLVDAFPRYYPSWCRPVVAVPGVREVATWNLAMVLEAR